MASSGRRAAVSPPRLFNTVRFGSRATQHRNLPGALFPERLPPEEMKRLRDKVCDAVMAAPSVPGRKAEVLRLGDPGFESAVARMAGRGEITRDFAAHAAGAALIHTGDGTSIIINDEDHLVVSCQGEGTLTEQARRAGAMARALEKRLPFATHPAYGYLSANPDNLGTGLRLYCTFSFFGLFLNKELDAVLRGIERLGLNVYPLYLLSEKEDNPLEAPGCCYVVASTQTMGRESDIIEGMEHVCEELEIAETNARLRLVDSRMPMLVDFLTRSVAVGSTAVQMTESEGLDIAHAILLGIDFGLLELSGDDQEMALNAPTLMTHAALSQIVPPEAETKSAVKDAPVQPMLIPEVGEGDGGGDDESADGAAEFAGLRNSRAFLMRQLAIKLLPQCLEKLGYKAVVKEIRSRR